MLNRLKTAKHLRIEGNVQGVGYRYSFQLMALQNGLTGWVRNNRDGSVEAVVQGDERAVLAAIEWAKHGPDMAQVDHVTVADTAGEYLDFSIRETS